MLPVTLDPGPRTKARCRMRNARLRGAEVVALCTWAQLSGVALAIVGLPPCSRSPRGTVATS